jgi:hypothetical protein
MKKISVRIGIAVSLAALALAIALVSMGPRSGDGNVDRDKSVVGGSESVSGSDGEQELATGDGGSAEALPAPDERGSRGDTEGQVEIFVRDSSGNPVEGASVSLAVAESEGASSPLPSLAHGIALSESTVWGDTGPDGVLTWSTLPSQVRSREAVVWVTRPGFFAESRPLDVTAGEAHVEVVLEVAPEFVVSVTGLLDDPLADATVYQLGLSRDAAKMYGCPWGDEVTGEDTPTVDEEALPLLVRVGSTGRDGSFSMPRPRSPTIFVATAEGGVSELRAVPTVSSGVELQVFPLQTARGQVHTTAGTPLPSEATVSCSWSLGVHQQPLFVSRVAPGGEWGPVEIPAVPEGFLSFRLSGGSLIPVEVSRAADPLLDSHVVDFQASTGKVQWAKVVDGEGEPLVDVLVEVRWETPSGPFHAQAWTGSDGRAGIDGCPQTECDFRASKPGYTEFRWPGIYIVTPGDIDAVLEEAGVVTGSVSWDENPVEDFQIHSWTDDPREAQLHRTPRDAQGQFRLDTLPTGQVTLLASSTGLADSEPVTLELVAGEPQTVEFELESGLTGHGQVVDAYSGEPLAGAKVAVLVQHSSAVLGSTGVSAVTATDGTFELEGLPEGSSTISIEYPGMVGVKSTGSPDASQRTNFGVIPIALRQDLSVRLLGEPPFETDLVWFMAEGDEPISYVPLDPSGELLIPDVAPGIYTCLIVWNDGSSIAVRRDFRPGEEWSVEFEFETGDGLEVQLVPLPGESLPPNLKIGAGWNTRENFRSKSANVSEEGRAVFDHIPDGQVIIQVASETFVNLLATRQITLGDSSLRHIEIELSGRTLEITAVDSDGDPLLEGLVTINTLDTNTVFISYQHLSSPEPLSVGGLCFDDLMVSVRHPVLGLGYAPVTMSPDGTTQVTVEAGGGLPLELLVRDIEGPVSAVRCMLIPKDVITRGYQGDSDAGGSLRYEGMPPHTYTADLDRYGYWPVEHEFEFTGQPLIELPIRRRGNFEATVYGVGGAQVSGVPIALHSLEFDTPVSAWIESGRLSSGWVNLISDVQGQVSAEGIPRGAYRWSVTRADGTPLSGVTEVPPGGTATELISIAE